MTAICIPSACLASNIVLIGNKTSMFEVKIRLALIQSLFYPPQAIHVYGVDLYDDGRCLLKNLLMELLIRRLRPLLLIRGGHDGPG